MHIFPSKVSVIPKKTRCYIFILGNNLLRQKSLDSPLLPTNCSTHSIDDSREHNSLSQSPSLHSYIIDSNDIHTVGESRRRRNKRNNLSDSHGFESRINSTSGVPNTRQTLSSNHSVKSQAKEKDFLIHRLSEDQLDIHDTRRGSSKENVPSISRDEGSRQTSSVR